MTYATSNQPSCVTQRVAGGPAIWIYEDGDAIADVDATGYFSDGEDLGMQVGDIVFIHDTTNSLVSVGHVSAISAAGAATVVGMTAFP